MTTTLAVRPPATTSAGRSRPRPLVIAHRGATLHHRENTLPAIAAAIDAGADAVEVDVRLAADGSAVLVHDETFERLWGDPRPVAAMTGEEIARLGAGDVRVPTLEDALRLSRERDVPLVLDQKTPAAALAAARAVHRVGAARTAYCGEVDGLLAVRELDPAATLYLNDTSSNPPDIRLLALLRPSFYNPSWHLLSPATISAMRTFGIRSCCWTPNTDEDLALVLHLGVDAVMTDRIDLLTALVGADTPTGYARR